MKRKVLKLNYHPETIANIGFSKKGIDISVGNKTGISITEDGVNINCASPAKFNVTTAGVSKCGFYQETPFPLCFLAGPISMPSQIPQIPFGLPNVICIAQMGAVTAAMATAFAALGAASAAAGAAGAAV